MNITSYIFGKFKSGYNQYPDDYTNSILKFFKENSKAKTQLAIHRKDDLMYYGYIRMLEEECYIGLCVVINGHYTTSINSLFGVFENVIELMVRNGYFIHFNEQGEIVASTKNIVGNREGLDELNQSLVCQFENLTYKPLPAVSYDKSSLSVKDFCIQDPENDIIASSISEGYTLVYKSKRVDTTAMLGYKGVIARLNNRIKDLEAGEAKLMNDNKELRGNLSKQKRKQRNTTWVGILTLVVVVFGFIIWNKVLFPDEVTKFDAGEFLYYGPMVDGKPNGTGVAIYRKNDKDNRLYYYGNFSNGKRVDNNAIMFYRDGSYFRGSMEDDNWKKGKFYDIDGDFFVGTFKDNSPYIGNWYKHELIQNMTGQ